MNTPERSQPTVPVYTEDFPVFRDESRDIQRRARRKFRDAVRQVVAEYHSGQVYLPEGMTIAEFKNIGRLHAAPRGDEIPPESPSTKQVEPIPLDDLGEPDTLGVLSPIRSLRDQ